MTPKWLRRIARLEELATPHAAVLLEEEKQQKLKLCFTAGNAAVLVLLAHHGNPQIGEPLSRAMARCSESEAWQECCERFKERHLGDRRGCSFFPETKDDVLHIGQEVRHFIISSLPGANEKEKLDRAFAALPPWLIWFTFADYTAALLRLTIPDLRSVSRFARPWKNFRNWWGVPTGAFEETLWPHGPAHERLARIGLDLMGGRENRPPENLTPRERKRQRKLFAEFDQAASRPSWPYLEPEEVLRLPKQERDALFARLPDGTGPAPQSRHRRPGETGERRARLGIHMHSLGAPHKY
jgi:hypothetical protein